MKRFFALAALVLGLASCQTEPEGLDVRVDGEVDATITVTIADAETRAGGNDSALGVFNNGILDGDATMRYILQVYYGETRSNERLVKYSDDRKVDFDVRLVPNRDYKFVVWADVVDGEADVDKHYNTSDLKNITINNNTWGPMDESRDAFTDVKVVTNFTAQSSINLELTRPLAKLRVKTTDMVEMANIGVAPKYATVEYTTPYRAAFNAFVGKAVDAGSEEKSHNNFVIADYGDNNTNNKILFTDYFFAENGDSVSFILDVKEADGELIKSNNFNTDIAVNRNYLTTIYGHILTDGNNIKVDVKDAFANAGSTDPNYEYKTISSDKEFLAAVNTPGKYIVISNLHIANEGDTVNNGQVGTLSTRAAGNTTIIDLNGKTITVENKGTGALASVAAGNTLVITNTVDGGKIELTEGSTGAFIENNGIVVIENGNIESNSTNDAPVIDNNGTTNITGGELEAGAITNNGTTEVAGGVINENAIVNEGEGKTNVTGGEFTYAPEADEVEEGFKVTEENGKFVVTESDPVAQIGNKQYTTLKAAFEAVESGQTIKILSDITTRSTAVLAEGKTVTLDLNGMTISNPNDYAIENYGTLIIDGNGNFEGLGNIRSHAGKVTINSGTFTGSSDWNNGTYQHILKAKNTEVVINGGTFDATIQGMTNAMINVSENSVVTINGGTFKNVNGVIPQFAPYMFTYEKNGKLIIKDGVFYGGWRFNGETTTTDIYGGNFTVSYDGQSFHASSTHVLTVYGGVFYLNNGGKLKPTSHCAEGYIVEEEDGAYKVVKDVKVAKVGTTEYRKIDEAIANWTNNTTLTLMSDVTLSDVITLKSTEHHILNLSTFTMTAASGKNAIEITPYGDGAGTAAKSCLTINADANNPGHIAAGSKACIYYKKTNGINDRIMVTINGGVFDGTISSSSNNGGQACPYFVFNGGVFNKSINLTKAMLKVTGGTFHSMFSCTGDSTAYRLISGGTFKSWTFMTADAANKFSVGTDKQVYNVGVYVNDEGYLVVGGPVITEFGDKFAAKATNATKWSSYLQYSSAAANGLYYTNAEMATKKHGEANVVLKQ